MKTQIKSALGCLVLLLALSACGEPVKKIQVSAKPVNKPELVLPRTGELNLKNVTWFVITPENIEEKWAELEASGQSLVFFAVSAEGYENVSLNLNDLRSYIQSQQATIVAYKKYYNAADTALNEANEQLKKSYWETW